VASGLPSFDLVVATLGRAHELDRLLASLEEQTYRAFRVLVVDQNPAGMIEDVLEEHQALDLVRLRSPAGLSRARNAALAHLGADVVAFPDDDCVYPADLLERVGRRLRDQPTLAGLSVRTVDESGISPPFWKKEPAVLDDDNLWNRAVSYSIFLRRELVEATGRFDEELGLGSGRAWHSGEEIEYLVRALRVGARIRYDPDLVVVHPQRRLLGAQLRDLGHRDGASVGYILRKHRYPRRVIARMLLRPLGGVVLSLARLDRERAGFHLATLRGRIAGLRAPMGAPT
jgi:GT2 family glycosyltransferase